MRIGGGTRFLALLGQGIGHTLSPMLQNAAIEKLGEDLVYLPIEIDAADLGDLLRIFPRIGGIGLNVTTPHKSAIGSLVRAGDVETQRTGVVNTVVFGDDRTPVGFSTDGSGFCVWLREKGIAPGPGGAVILGFGATSRSLVHAMGPDFLLTVVTRSPREVEKILRSWETMGWRASGYRVLSWNEPPPGQGLLVVGGLPVGAARSEPVTRWLSRIDSASIVVDLNYGPDRTPLRDRAAELGLRAHDGLGLLVHQACLSLGLWLGREVSPSLLKDGLPPGME